MFRRKLFKYFKYAIILIACSSAVVLFVQLSNVKRRQPKSGTSIQEEKTLDDNDLVTPIDLSSIDNKLNSSLNYNVHIFYYAWYGAPQQDGQWIHWNHNYIENWDKTDKKVYPKGSHVPPDDIGANFYPSLGPYSSRNESVIDQHFQWIQKSNIGVVAVSWYPPGMADENGLESDNLIPTLLNIAHKYKIKVCLHVEPFENRTAENVRKHLQYVKDTYGSHPAYYKFRRGGRLLPLFYIYDSYQVKSDEWKRLLSRKGDLTVRDTDLDGIFIALCVEMQHRYSIKRSMFDGMYTYFAANGFTYGSTWKNWKSLADYAYKNSLLFIPSVGPGYVDTRVRPWNNKNTRDRRNGLYYETAWRTALSTSAKIISITSFNEWHEGTQIEPASPHSYSSYSYQSYYPHDPDLYLRITYNFTQYPSINPTKKI